MTKDQALDLALDAVEWIAQQRTGGMIQRKATEAITAIKQARSAHVHKPYRPLQDNGSQYFGDSWDTPPAQPAPVQEPVAWMHWLNGPCRVLMNKDEAMMELDRLNREYPADSHARKMRPLVFGDTTPPATKLATEESSAVAAPVQEPEVSWGVDWGKAGDISCVSIIKRLPEGGIQVVAVEYAPYSYTTPPAAQRPFVGLTDEEIQTTWDSVMEGAVFTRREVYKAIEAKLRSKNNG